MSGKKIVCMMACAAVSLFGTFAAEPTVPRVSARPGKILIAYYSWSGNTRFAAEQIQKATGGTLFEIKPVKAYPKDYKACVDLARKECPAGFKPALASEVSDMAKYEVVFVGTPNWCSTMAPPVRSFLASYDFSGKTVIPFVTHGSGGKADGTRTDGRCRAHFLGYGECILKQMVEHQTEPFGFASHLNGFFKLTDDLRLTQNH